MQDTAMTTADFFWSSLRLSFVEQGVLSVPDILRGICPLCSTPYELIKGENRTVCSCLVAFCESFQ